MDNLYILTEERAKINVICDILQIYCNKYDKNMEIINPKIIPEIKNKKYAFNSYITGIKVNGIENIIISCVSGESSFVDYLVFEQLTPPKEESDNNLVLMIEETKTSDKESRNTGVYQRSSKFAYADEFYPDVPKYMLYNIEDKNKRRPSATNIFGTNMLLTQNVKIIGKDISYFKRFNNINELITFKNNMRAPPKGNVPIEITLENDTIKISGRLSKPKKEGNIAHDPNIGCLSSIAKTLRVLKWNGPIIITDHGVKQEKVDNMRSNKFLNIATRLDVQLEGITFDVSDNIPNKYWHYDKSSEKNATILLHLLAENLNENTRSIYENHAGCERGYFYKINGTGEAVPKKDENKCEIAIPDLVLSNNNTKEILIIEGKKSSTLEQGLEEINNYDLIENKIIKPEYPDYSISRWVTTFGEDIYYGNLNIRVLLHLNRDGSFYVNEKAPNWIKELFKDNVELFMRDVLKDEEELVVDH